MLAQQALDEVTSLPLLSTPSSAPTLLGSSLCLLFRNK